MKNRMYQLFATALVVAVAAFNTGVAQVGAPEPTTSSGFTIQNPAGESITLTIPPSGVIDHTLLFPASAPSAGSLLYASSGSGDLAWLGAGSNGSVLTVVAGVPQWQSVNVLPTGTTTNATLVWNGTQWIENSNVTLNPISGDAIIGGDLTVNGTDVNLPSGSIDNNELANSSISMSYGSGITGDASVSLGGTLNLSNSGVTSLIAGTGVSVSGSTGDISINNTGVTSLAGTTNQVNVSPGSTGDLTLSTPQDIHTGASPTFLGMTLTGLPSSSTSTDVVVSNAGTLETRTLGSLGGAEGDEPFITFGADGGSLTDNRVLTSGTAISLVNSGADDGTLTINNDGVTSATAGTGISLSGSTGDLTITNAGVTSAAAGTGISLTGGPTGSITINNDGVTDLTAGSGISLSGSSGSVTVTNSGVTSLTGTTNQINVSPGSTGDLTLSTPQDIHTGASPTFLGMTLTGLPSSSTSTDVVVSNAGVLETRTLGSLGGAEGDEPFITFGADGGSLTDNRVLTGGTAISLVNSGTDDGTLTINNDGVTSATAGSGISVTGGPTGDITIVNDGVTDLTAGSGISLSGSSGSVTVTNSGVTSLTGTTNQVNVSPGSTGDLTLSTPQAIHSGASPTFLGMTLTGLPSSSTSTDVVVSNAGVLETRTLGSLGGAEGDEPFITFGADGGSLTDNRVLTGGTAISLVNSGADDGTLTINNDGVTSATAGTGISLSGSTGDVTITNAGVTSAAAGTGISLTGGPTGSITINNDGVTDLTAGSGISLSGSSGSVTVTNSGVTSLTGTTNQVNVSPGSTGDLTLSTPQDIHTGATPTFDGLTLSNMPSSSTSTELVVSNSGVLETRSLGSLGGAEGDEPFITFGADGGSLSDNRVLTGGTAISLVNSGSDDGTLTINNDGVTSATAGTGISVTGGPTGDITISNDGVTDLTAGSGISLSGSSGSVTVTNTGVTSLTGTANQVNVTPGTTGDLTVSTPQDIHTAATPTFDGMFLTSPPASSTSTEIVVWNSGSSGRLETRDISTLPGLVSVASDATLTGLGTTALPLGIDLANPNLWTGTQTFSTAIINGGSINSTPIGQTTPAAGTFTTLTSDGNTTLGDGSGDNLDVDVTGGAFNIAGVTQDNTATDILVVDSNGDVYTRDATTLVTGGDDWSLTGNSGTTAGTNFLGTTDNTDFVIKTNNTEAVRVDAAGDVGLGTTTPSQALEVQDGNVLLSNTGTAGELRLAEPSSDGSHYSSFKAANQPTNIDYTLPDSAGVAGDFLVVNSVSGTGLTLKWSSPSTTGAVGTVLFARRTTDTSITSNSALETDTSLELPLQGDKTYEVSGALHVVPDGNLNLDVTWDIPTGATMLISYFANVNKSGNSNAGADVREDDATGAINDAATYSDVSCGSNRTAVHFKGLVVMPSTGGTIKQMYGSNGNTDFTVKKNSYIRASVAEK